MEKHPAPHSLGQAMITENTKSIREHRDIYLGSIAAPPRSSRVAAAIVLAVIGTLSLAMIAPGSSDKWILAALTVLLFSAIVCKADYAIHIALLSLLWVIAVGFVPHFQSWPLNPLAPLVVYGMAVVLTPQLRRSVGWLRMGHSGPDVRLMVITVIIVSSAALVMWTVFSKSDIQRHLALLPEMPLWLYPLAGIGFAAINAAMEELVFRGVMMEALDSALGETFWSVGVQALSFAALHYAAGFPNGAAGFLMVFVYGVMLGMVRRRSKGLLAPWVAHVAADITIFAALVVILVFKL